MEWITILDAQNRLGQLNQLRHGRVIIIFRNGRAWDCGPPMLFDVFKVSAQGWVDPPRRSLPPSASPTDTATMRLQEDPD
jgi:hypothetical protein